MSEGMHAPPPRQHLEERLEASWRLMRALTQVQVDLVTEGDHGALFEQLLCLMLDETQSEYGFIGEILRPAGEAPYLRTYANTNLTWLDELRAQYEPSVRHGVEFHNLDTLFGKVVTTGEPVLINTPAPPDAMGVPLGHPQLRAFLGVPFKVRGEVVGMVGMANRPGGYTQEHIDFLQPLLTTCGIITYAWRSEQGERERARELHLKNEALSQAIQQLRDTQQQLIAQEKLAALGALTAGIAHELKNPLNFINGFAETSEEFTEELARSLHSQQPHLEPAAWATVDEVLTHLRHNMARIREHGLRATQIINGMLMHSWDSSGAQVMRTSLDTVLKEAVQLAYEGFRTKAPEFELQLHMHLDPAVGELDMRVLELSRVFINLVDNACYALHQKKRALKDAFSPRLDVATRELGERVEIRIRDNGSGISSAHLGKVFSPFYTTKPAGEGAGLGLSISRDIILGRHRGDLRVESVEGQFTEFVIELPRHLRDKA